MTTSWFAKWYDVKRWWKARQQQSTVARSNYGPAVMLVTDGNDQERSHQELIVRLAPLLQELLPGYGYCLRCGWPWPLVLSHSTPYESGDRHHSMFPLCEKCWRELWTGEKRLPYYRTLYDNWNDPTYANWGDIEKAVLEGK